jgi:hypothetical protein
MEKRGVIDEKNTRPETGQSPVAEKNAGANLDNHTTKRLADVLEKPRPSEDKKS